MACSCGGGRKSTAGQAFWVLTLPTGMKKTYSNEADANRAQARLGGTVSALAK